jgi:hypothetical protein
MPIWGPVRAPIDNRVCFNRLLDALMRWCAPIVLSDGGLLSGSVLLRPTCRTAGGQSS